MYLPDTYILALIFMIGSMLCWGSWANTMKLCPGYRFQLFYWDYVIGLFVGVAAWGFTFGSLGATGLPFWQGLAQAHRAPVLEALLSGILFNIANILLVAAIEVAGMAVAFPVGIGFALVIGAASSYLFTPQGNPWLLFGGIALVLTAIICDSLAYRERESASRAGDRRGLILSLISGALMGSFYPVVSRAMSGPQALGPYAVALPFAVGVALCALPLNYLFMRKPIDGGPKTRMPDYGKAPVRWHLAGILGGAIWASGAILNFVASRVHFVGPAISYSIGQGATMVSAVWGVFIWHEFRSPSPRVQTLLFWMFVCFILGLTAIAAAPLFHS
jgi:glucose uptake protein